MVQELSLSREVLFEDEQASQLFRILPNIIVGGVFEDKLLFLRCEVAHDGFIKSFNALLLFLEETKVTDNTQRFLQLLYQDNELLELVMSDLLFDLGDPILEMFDFLRHLMAPLYPLRDLVQLQILVTDL